MVSFSQSWENRDPPTTSCSAKPSNGTALALLLRFGAASTKHPAELNPRWVSCCTARAGIRVAPAPSLVSRLTLTKAKPVPWTHLQETCCLDHDFPSKSKR